MAFLCLAGCSSPEIQAIQGRRPPLKSGTCRRRTPLTTHGRGDDDKRHPVTWEEYFYWLNSCITALDSDNGGLIENWNSRVQPFRKGESYAQYAMSSVERP